MHGESQIYLLGHAVPESSPCQDEGGGSLPSSGVTGELALNSDFWAWPNERQRKPRQCKAYCPGCDASPPIHSWATLYWVGWDHPTLLCQSCTGILAPWFVAQQSKGWGEGFFNKIVLDHICVWRFGVFLRLDDFCNHLVWFKSNYLCYHCLPCCPWFTQATEQFRFVGPDRIGCTQCNSARGCGKGP